MCDKKCHEDGCPFAFTEESEKIQNYGCLPEPFDIVAMRVIKGKTWACHSDNNKPCLGALKFMKERNIECKIIDTTLINEKNIHPEHVEFTLHEAERVRKLIMKK